MSVELERAKSEILTLKRELSAVKLDLRVSGTKKDESPALKAEIKRLGSEVDSLTAENGKLRSANKTLKEQMEAARIDGKHYKALAESECKAIQKSESEIAKLNAKLDSIKSQKSEKARSQKIKDDQIISRTLKELEAAKVEIGLLKKALRDSEAEAKKMRGLFSPGPDLERQKLRDRLKKAEIELWRLKDVRDK